MDSFVQIMRNWCTSCGDTWSMFSLLLVFDLAPGVGNPECLEHTRCKFDIFVLDFLGACGFGSKSVVTTTCENEYSNIPGLTARPWGRIAGWNRYLPCESLQQLQTCPWCCALRADGNRVGVEGEGDFVGFPYFSLSSSVFLLGWARLHGDFWRRERQRWRRYGLFFLVQVPCGNKRIENLASQSLSSRCRTRWASVLISFPLPEHSFSCFGPLFFFLRSKVFGFLQSYKAGIKLFTSFWHVFRVSLFF